MSKYLLNERGDAQLIVTLVLIAVAICLCIVFRNKMGGILNSALDSISNAVQSLFASGDGDTVKKVSMTYTYKSVA